MKRLQNTQELRLLLSVKLKRLNSEIKRLAVRALTSDTAARAMHMYKDRLAEQLNLLELIFGAAEVTQIIKQANI